MPDEPKEKDAVALWRNQPEESKAVNLQSFANRRAMELHASTRSEIFGSIGAALSFVVVMVLIFRSTMDTMQQTGLLVVVAWIIITAYRFRAKLFSSAESSADRAATGLAYYRRELEERRDHLRSAWLWHGPLLLAIALLVLTAAGHAWPSGERLRNMLPFLVLLLLWVGLSLYRRRLVVGRLESEIRELGHLSDDTK